VATTRGLGPLTGRQVNLLLELLVVAAVATGLASWAAGDRWNGALAVSHGVVGLALLLLVPAKLRGPVATGFRRGRATRWVSAAFGILVLATVAVGIAHATGIWYGVGYWSALWVHCLLAVTLIPLFVWHLVSRPVRPRAVDLDRRVALRGGLVLAGAAAVHVAQRAVAGAAGLAGGDRRLTGSHEVASFDPASMPETIWLDDRRPEDTDEATWQLVVAGRPISVDVLRRRARPVVARLDCTGGWWSDQSWDAVPLVDLLGQATGRSIRVGSATGYHRLFAVDAVDDMYLAVGYGGDPLHDGHGAPVRLIAPGRRGYWCVKWVTSVEPDDRPSWLQSPLPLT
jgi:hypothetical protein